MPNADGPIILATRGSPLALAQTNNVLAQCRAAFPGFQFEIKIFKTTGDKLQTASMALGDPSLPKGLFTKELEVALLAGEADLAVHSLKDLPTDLPDGLHLGAVGKRADVRDVLVYRAERPDGPRGFRPNITLQDLPDGATIATSSTRRREQLLALRPALKVVEIRGNVGTRLRKVAEDSNLDATVLAAAGLARLGFRIHPDGRIEGPAEHPAPDGLLAIFLEPDVMLPCVGQAAVGIETRLGDPRVRAICERLNDVATFQCVTAERAFLKAMGGGCLSPVAAYAQIRGSTLDLRAVSFRTGRPQRARLEGAPGDATLLGQRIASEINSIPV